MSCVVYWLYDDNCVCLWRHGYVGVSGEWKGRLKNHRKTFGKEVKWQVLFNGTRQECYVLEGKLRPDRFIGWNDCAGGQNPRGHLGKKHSEETRKLLRQKSIGYRHSDEAKKLISLAGMGRTNKGRLGQKKSEEERRKISLSHTGKTLSEDHCRKISALKIGNKNRLGKFHSEQTKQQIRLKKIGVPIHSEEFKKKQRERLAQRNRANKGKPWTDARRQAQLARHRKD